MQRRSDSHKGENGKVAIIGGSLLQHGAPLFSALAAEAGGCDLLFVSVPAAHAEISRSASLNFQVTPFAGDELSKKDVRPLLELLATVDCAVIGPGISRTDESLSALKAIVEGATCPLVLDASALQPWTLKSIQGKEHVVTPHLGELERMGISPEALTETASTFGVTILAKGIIDRIVSVDGTTTEVAGGTAGLTVGGTGDALAGLTASLIAQHLPTSDACRLASTAIKRAAMILNETQKSFATREVIALLPRLLSTIA